MYIKRAMPLHPKVVEKDYQSDQSVDEISDILMMLEGVEDPDEYSDLEYFFNPKLRRIWFNINLKKGINLSDREKLLPIFQELNRIFGVKKALNAYRGVRLSNFDPNALSETYPNLEIGGTVIPKEPRIIEHLEGLAYGLRSWSRKVKPAVDWANSKDPTTKDKVIFKIQTPEVIVDANPILDVIDKSYSPFDWDEVILFVKNPKIINIKNKSPIWEVTIKDN